MEDNAKVVAVLGRNRRLGRWRVAGHTLVVAVFGTCQLDLTRALIDEEDEAVELVVFALFGNVTVHLPQGTDVQPSGIAIASSASLNMDQADVRQAGAPLSLEWTTLFSRLRVTEEQGLPPAPSVPVAQNQPELAFELEGEAEPEAEVPAEPEAPAAEPRAEPEAEASTAEPSLATAES